MALSETIILIGLIFLFMPFLAFFGVLISQYRSITTPKSHPLFRVQILSTRLALCIPTYALLMYISMVAPNAYEALTIPVAFAEGASFYSFFGMIVKNLGGPEMTVNVLNQINRPPFFNCCSCQTDGQTFYQRTRRALFFMFSIRVVFVILSVIFTYLGEKDKKALILGVLFDFVSAGFVVYVFISLINFYEMLYPVSHNVYGVLKLLLMKGSVGLMVLEGIIMQLVAFAKVASPDTCIQVYCFVYLVEIGVMSLIMYISFSSTISENKAVVDGVVVSSGSGGGDARSPAVAEEGSEYNSKDAASAGGSSFCEFFCAVFSFYDYGDSLVVKEALLAPSAQSSRTI